MNPDKMTIQEEKERSDRSYKLILLFAMGKAGQPWLRPI